MHVCGSDRFYIEDEGVAFKNIFDLKQVKAESGDN